MTNNSPCSAGIASSFHLVWRLPVTAQLVEVSAVLEVITPPSISALYFWALQVDFSRGQSVWGGGHTGLQWNPRYPGNTAVNWGGYTSRQAGGAVLQGSVSSLPGFTDDPNTLAFPWLPARPYRFRVYRSPDHIGAWRAEVTDLLLEKSTVIRDLFPSHDRGNSFFRRLIFGRTGTSAQAGEAAYLSRPIVWSEVFAECDAPSVAVRWSDLVAVDEKGTVSRPLEVEVNYQSASAGGCANTSVSLDEAGGVLQMTNTRRLVKQGTRLVIGGCDL